MDEELLQAATSKLEFRDIVLHTCKLDRSPDLDPLLYPALVRQRAEHEVVTDRLYFADADDEEVEILRNYIRFLISAFEKPAEDEPSDSVDDTLLFSIEAEYRVDYLVIGDLSDEEVEVFSKYNVVHNAWPFWRQHVYQTVRNAKLPHINIPFFRRDPETPKPKRTKRKRAKRKLAKN